jgi:ABC-2 type transport system permease protein
LGGAYLNQIITAYNADIRLQWFQPDKFNTAPVITLLHQIGSIRL